MREEMKCLLYSESFICVLNLTSVIILALTFLIPQIVMYLYLAIPMTKFFSRLGVGRGRSIFVDENLVEFSDKVLGRIDEERIKRNIAK